MPHLKLPPIKPPKRTLLAALVAMAASCSGGPPQLPQAASVPPAQTATHRIDPLLATADLEIHITDARSSRGVFRVIVSRDAAGFPGDTERAALVVVVPAAGGAEPVVHLRLVPGTYAVAVLHDENNNGRLDTNLLGIPTEGIGVTNNPKPRFRGPRYTEAAIPAAPGINKQTVSLQYY